MKPFKSAEFTERIAKVRRGMAERGLDGCVITNPENVYYLTGLHHQGYFAYTSLILPLEGEPVLIARAMEHAIIHDMLEGIRFFPYSDGIPPLPESGREDDVRLTEPAGGEDTAAYPVETRLAPDETAGLQPWSMSVGVSIRTAQDTILDYDAPVVVTCEALKSLGLDHARVAFEQSSSFLPYRIANGFVTKMSGINWTDAGDLVNDCRMIQSPNELKYTRKAGEISDAMVMAATAVAGPGVFNQDVMAAVYQVMFQRGGTYPAYVPLVRSTRTIAHEHGTWDLHRLHKNDLLFLEMSGCYWRYHAPVGRLVYIGAVTQRSRKIYSVALDALHAAAEALKPGVVADEVYHAWHKVVVSAGLTHYERHHCGYMVGIGFPPSWSGAGVPRGLRRGSRMEIQPGMVFHLLSWLLLTGQGDAFLSDTAIVTENGCEFVTRAPRDLIVR